MSTHTIRRWIFLATTFDDEEFYLGGDGEQLDETQTVPFVGTNDEALTEAGRRSDCWAIVNNAFVAKVTAQSQGVISEGETSG